MKPFIISTDSTADLAESYIATHHINILPLYYTVDGVTYGAPDKQLSHKAFYNAMRNGAAAFTHATNPLEIMKTMNDILEKGFDILHISFSSNLSSAFNNVSICANELMSKHPEAKIIVVDSLSATTGLGLLVHKAVQLQKDGYCLEQLAQYIEENVPHVIHEFTVDDLNFLKRSGRVSNLSAFIASKLKLKPIMHMNAEGKLEGLYQVHGRRKALNTLVKRMAPQIHDFEQDIIFVAHSDCYEDAEYVANLIKENYEVKEVIINEIGPAIGSHVGPGTLSIQYLGSNRNATT